MISLKKLWFVLFFTLLATPFNLYATSGACSHHGGVSCEAGRDWDGSVICTDGWKESSVAYDDMVMCRGFNSYPCTQESHYAALYSDLISSGSLQYSFSSQKLLDACRESITKANKPKNSEIPVEPVSFTEQQTTLYETKVNYCKSNYGSGSFYKNDTGKCHCVSNYGFDTTTNKCAPLETIAANSCKTLAGPFSIVVPGDITKCTCQDGYHLNESNQCIANLIINEPIVEKITEQTQIPSISTNVEPKSVITSKPKQEVTPIIVASTPQPLKEKFWKRVWTKIKFW